MLVSYVNAPGPGDPVYSPGGNPSLADTIGNALGLIATPAIGTVCTLALKGISKGVGAVGKAIGRGIEKAAKSVKKPKTPAPKSANTNRGRAHNRLKATEDAHGPYSSFRRDQSGKVSHYTTFDKNPHTGEWRPAKRFRGSGGKHGKVNPPLVLDRKAGKGPGSMPVVPRKPEPWELPRGY